MNTVARELAMLHVKSQVSDRAFVGVAALAFLASAATTIVWCGSMAGMSGMPMPGDWTMSMTWMRMPGQEWSGAALSFIAMWSVMMVAMMLPSLMPMLSRYRRALVGRGVADLGRKTFTAGTAYFIAWSISGAIIFPLGIGLAQAQMQHASLAQAVPALTGLVLVLCGAFQFTAIKQRCLACCRAAPRCLSTAGEDSAWRDGVKLAVRCAACCANLMLILLVIGVMDLVAMAIVTVAITSERVAPSGKRAAQVNGVVAVVAGWFLTLDALVAATT
ncbi:putative metal-binding membrane protein [Povalibacter uvarum]|uniref:Putative metal-binding membrane protein n=2 Tax=Povalibacter uvarum TaxID=732238 RepID=A0A841HVX8_9GAMM|nr:putative metal-binding membrane protein [Povalibacter uvarum]